MSLILIIMIFDYRALSCVINSLMSVITVYCVANVLVCVGGPPLRRDFLVSHHQITSQQDSQQLICVTSVRGTSAIARQFVT